MKKRPAIKFTPPEDKYILENYMALSFGEIATKLNRGRTSIRNRLIKLGIIITAEMTQRRWFKKGHTSTHKGKKQEDFCSHEHIETLKKVRFQPGHKSFNAKKDLEILLRWMSNGKKYYWIRIAAQKWTRYHTYLWLQAGYEIPEGHIVVFKDNDPMNCVLENLECITRAESLRRNKLINWNNISIGKPKLSKRRSAKYRKRKREQIIADKKLKSVSRQDERNWSKKYLTKQKFVIADMTNLIPVRVDHKTIIYVKPGADIPTILKQYQKKAS